MTIQRYIMGTNSRLLFGERKDYMDMVEDDKGEYVEWDDIKHLIEWEDLTEKNKPELGDEFWLWAKDDDEPIVETLELKHGSGIPNLVKIGKYFVEHTWEEDDMEQSTIYIVGEDELKWKSFVNPWNKS